MADLTFIGGYVSLKFITGTDRIQSDPFISSQSMKTFFSNPLILSKEGRKKRKLGPHPPIIPKMAK